MPREATSVASEQGLPIFALVLSWALGRSKCDQCYPLAVTPDESRGNTGYVAAKGARMSE